MTKFGKKDWKGLVGLVTKQRGIIKKEGRVRGGMVLTIKIEQEIEKKKWKRGDTGEMLGIEFETNKKRWMIITVCMGKERRRNMGIINQWLEEKKEDNVIIYGDLNARTGDEGRGWDEEGKKKVRKSRDKIMNQEGKEIIKWVEDNGMQIRNGNSEGNEEGDYTYIGARGQTVIDYVIRRGKEEDDKLKINEIIGSDHLSLLYEWEEKEVVIDKRSVKKQR